MATSNSDKNGVIFFIVRKTCRAIANNMMKNVMAVILGDKLLYGVYQCSYRINRDAYFIAGL